MKIYYQDEAVTIYHGDCRNVLPQLDPADLVLTSPPYNLGNTTGGGSAKTGHYSKDTRLGKRGGNGRWKGGSLANGYGICADSMPAEEYVEWQKEILGLAWDCLTPAGAIYYNHKPRVLNGELLTPFSYNPGLPLRQIVIWARAGGINFSPTFYCPTHEWICIFAKPDFRLRDKAASGVSDVWRIPQETKTAHPAPFPLALATQAIATTRAKLVLDPFMGSGTTLRAAKNLGLKAIGIEVEEKYCEMAAKRMAQSVFNFTEEV